MVKIGYINSVACALIQFCFDRIYFIFTILQSAIELRKLASPRTAASLKWRSETTRILSLLIRREEGKKKSTRNVFWKITCSSRGGLNFNVIEKYRELEFRIGNARRVNLLHIFYCWWLFHILELQIWHTGIGKLFLLISLRFLFQYGSLICTCGFARFVPYINTSKMEKFRVIFIAIKWCPLTVRRCDRVPR